jgi:predicted small lipoprotein YifL
MIENWCFIFKRKLHMKKSLVFAAMLAIALAACGKKEEAKPAEAPAAAPAAPAADAAKDAAPAAPAAPAADAKK